MGASIFFVLLLRPITSRNIQQRIITPLNRFGVTLVICAFSKCLRFYCRLFLIIVFWRVATANNSNKEVNLWPNFWKPQTETFAIKGSRRIPYGV